MSDFEEIENKAANSSTPSDSKEKNSPYDFFKELRSDDEVSLKELIENIWKGRLKIFYFGIVFLFIGLFHYTTAPNEYISHTKLLQEAENQQAGTEGLRMLGQLGGVNIGSALGGQRGLSPELYPEILESVEFLKELLFLPLEFSTLDLDLTLYEYFNDYYEEPFRDRFYRGVSNYTIRLPFTIYGHLRSLFRRGGQSAVVPLERVEDFQITDREVLILTPQFRFAMNQIERRIELEPEGGILRVETRLPDPMAASQFNLIIAERMREYIINYQNEKSRINLQFVEELHIEAAERYQKAQSNLAIFLDRNQGNLTATATLEQERLMDQRDLTFQLYSSISQRLEEARIRVQENTPIFTTFQRPILPTNPESTSVLIVPLFLLFGIFLSIVWIFGEKGYLFIREQISTIEN